MLTPRMLLLVPVEVLKNTVSAYNTSCFGTGKNSPETVGRPPSDQLTSECSGSKTVEYCAVKNLWLVEASSIGESEAAVTSVVEAEFVFGLRTFHLSC